MSYGMFTDEGNTLVERIAQAGMKLAQTDGERVAWQFAHRELHKLARAKGFGEATDTEVREIAAGELERLTGKTLTSDEYWAI